MTTPNQLPLPFDQAVEINTQPSLIEGGLADVTDSSAGQVGTGIDISDADYAATLRDEREDSGWGGRDNNRRDYGPRRRETVTAVVVSNAASVVPVTVRVVDSETKEERVGPPSYIHKKAAAAKERAAGQRVSPQLPLGNEADRAAALNAKDKTDIATMRAKNARLAAATARRHPSNPR